MQDESQTYEYTVILEPTEPQGYSVYVPALPGIVTSGDSLDDALAMAREAIKLYLDALRRRGEPIPVESPSKRRSRRVQIPVRVAA
jgi:antitoxin HicB